MAKKANNTDVATTDNATNETVPEVVLNSRTLSDSDVAHYLGAGFHQVVAQALPTSEVLGQPTLLGKDDKSFLIDMNLVVLGWRFNKGEYTSEFVSVLILTEAEQYFVLNDSSTGIYRQLKEITSRLGKQYGPIHVPHGLRASDYWLDDETGTTYTVKPDDVRTIPARTYYLS